MKRDTSNFKEIEIEVLYLVNNYIAILRHLRSSGRGDGSYVATPPSPDSSSANEDASLGSQ